MPSIQLSSRAKINLTLDVLRKREDHYHEVEMIMQTIHLCDDLYLATTEGEGISFECTHPHVPKDETNLILKGAELLFHHYQLLGGLEIYLQKNIPIAAGLGGGSSNGAAVLLGLSHLYSLSLKEDELLFFSSLLGSDVPFFIKGGTQLCTGRGTDLTSLPPLPSLPLLLVVPPLRLKTPVVYGELKEEEKGRRLWSRGVTSFLQEGDISSIKRNLGNDLEAPARRLNPHLNKIMEILLKEGLTPYLTGSGPTLYLFPQGDLEGVKERLQLLLGPEVLIIETKTAMEGILESKGKEGCEDETGCHRTCRG